MEKEICHVCKKEKKPYLIILADDDILSLMSYEAAREDGPICERCSIYYARTGEFKDATEQEFEIAKQANWFAKMMLKWWEKDGKMDNEDKAINMREWGGTVTIASWCRKELTKNSPLQR